MPSIDANPVFKYDLGVEKEGKFHAKISWDSLSVMNTRSSKLKRNGEALTG